ncbi:MAG: DUF1573 domain-containing protein [Gemmataceae bacterium]
MHYAMLALITLSLPVGQGQTDRWAEKMFAGGGTSHDFGNVPRGAQLHHRFKITNIYAVPMQVVGQRSSCGCVIVTPPSGAIAPRESAYLDVTMDTRRFTGPKTVQIFITVGPQFMSTAVLQVSANCRSDVVFNPGEVDFGIVPQGQTPTQVIDVEYAGPLDWKITGIVTNNSPVDVNVEQLYRQPGKVGYRLRITLKADAPVGNHRYDLSLMTNDPVSPLVPMLVEANVQATLSVVPSTVNMGDMQRGETTARRVVVRGAKPFRILQINGLGDGLEADLPSTSQTVHVVTIRCQGKQPGEIRRQLQFKTDLSNEITATVLITGQCLP